MQRAISLSCYFNSRPHGGRLLCVLLALRTRYFNSRPHGGRHATLVDPSQYRRISTHALTEGDVERRGYSRYNNAFQLTPSRRATLVRYSPFSTPVISTHALTEGDVLCIDAHTGYEIATHALTEGDAEVAELRKSIEAFQLTPSRRATYLPHMILDATIFQLTPSRRATDTVLSCLFCLHISTHALTEGDRARFCSVRRRRAFQLTPSRRATFRWL